MKPYKRPYSRLRRYRPFVFPYWEGAGNPMSLDPRRITGTLNGTVPWAVGSEGVGLSFDGTGTNYLDLGNHVDFQFTDTTSFTILSVFDYTIDALYHDILRKDPLGAGRAFWLWRTSNTNKLECQFGDVSFALASIASATTLTAGPHVAAISRNVASDQLKIFLDGRLDATATDTSTGTWIVNGSTVQTRLSDGTEPAKGKKFLDIIFPFDALSDAELMKLTADPYSIFEQPPAPIAAFTTAASSFQPAWAMGANNLL